VGDTYFSGKMLAKLGRIIVIAQELRRLAEVSEHNEPDASQNELLKVVLKCRKANLPTEKEMNDAIARLRSSVEIWLNGSVVTQFTNDTAWGGLLVVVVHSMTKENVIMSSQIVQPTLTQD
jgi:hypothetical protein